MKRIETYVLPAHFVGALFNDDYTGLTEAEENEIDSFLASISGHCVGCSEEPFFAWHNDINNLGCTCLEYYFLTD